MQFLIFAFALFYVALGQNATNSTPTPTPMETPTPTPATNFTPTPTPPAEPTPEEVIAALEALAPEDVNDALGNRGLNLSAVGNVTFNGTIASYESADNPPTPNATFWAEQLQSVLCGLLNFTEQQCSERLNGTLYTPPLPVEQAKRVINLDNYRVDFEILEAVVPVVTPTPTPTLTPTPTPTPTDETPTPTPTPTPPTPTPTPTLCYVTCQDEFDTTKDSNPNWDTAGFTTQCPAWETQIGCLRACVPQPQSPNDAATRQQQCNDEPYVQDFCSCGGDPKTIDGTKVVAAANNYQNYFIGVLRSFPGVDQNAEVNWPTDQQGNTFSFTFVWDNEAQINPNNADEGLVTEEYLAGRVREFLADFFNSSPDNIRVENCGGKRAQQTTTFCVTYIETSQTGGVATLSMTFAFILVSFLLHVLL